MTTAAQNTESRYIQLLFDVSKLETDVAYVKQAFHSKMLWEGMIYPISFRLVQRQIEDAPKVILAKDSNKLDKFCPAPCAALNVDYAFNALPVARKVAFFELNAFKAAGSLPKSSGATVADCPIHVIPVAAEDLINVDIEQYSSSSPVTRLKSTSLVQTGGPVNANVVGTPSTLHLGLQIAPAPEQTESPSQIDPVAATANFKSWLVTAIAKTVPGRTHVASGLTHRQNPKPKACTKVKPFVQLVPSKTTVGEVFYREKDPWLVATTGKDLRLVPTLPGLGVTNLATKHSSYFALTKHGKLYSWGLCFDGALGREDAADAKDVPGLVDIPEVVVQVVCGHLIVAALTENGHVYAWGKFLSMSRFRPNINHQVKPFLIPEANRIVSISSTGDSLFAMTDAGEVLSWGDDYEGHLGRDATEDNCLIPTLSGLASLPIDYKNFGSVSDLVVPASLNMESVLAVGEGDFRDIVLLEPKRARLTFSEKCTRVWKKMFRC
ncbi:regulator of chromosome condensation 1/beta-lactamase-inhibitor protein II [Obelidium mucronatum]|nr:regulator of chromosome condensation 1/beta-lactamase-inhibitor protein II [Obelidium mucronatum]